MDILLNTLIPLDDPQQEDEHHLNVRIQNSVPKSLNIEPPISITELDIAIKNTKPKKATGPDRIPPEIFKNFDQFNRRAFLTLLNALLENEIFPEEWKAAKIKIIRKAGNRDWANPSSYRPISLLPIAGKIYERILKNRITTFLEDNSLLSVHQF